MKKDIKFLLVIVLATLCLYSGLLFFPKDQLYPAKDWWGQHRFWKSFLSDSFYRDGEIPLWNPMIFSGAPFLGHPTASTYFYPLNILFLRYNPDSVFKFYLLFHTLLAGIGMFYLVKRLLEDRFTALFGSLAFILGGAWMAKISYGQLTNMVVISYVPLLFLILHHLWRKPGWTASLLLGLTWGLQFNAGNVHLFYICALSMAFYILYLFIEELIVQKDWKLLIRKILLILLGSLIAVGIGAGQLLPSLETAAWSIRTRSDYDYCTTMSLPVWQTMSFVYSNIFGTPMDGSYIGAENYTELYGYVGLFPVLLALYYLWGKRDKNGYPWLFLTVLTLILSFGRFTPLYKLFYKIVPGINLFRIPSTFLFVYVFALIITSCFGLKKLLERESESKKERLFVVLLIFLILLTVIVLLLRPVDSLIKSLKPGLYSDGTGSAITLAAVHALILLIVFTFIYFLKLKRTWAAVLLISFLSIDLLTVAMPLLKTENIQKTTTADYPWMQKISEDDSLFRIYDIKPVPQQVSLRYNLQKITGMDPIILKHYFDFTNQMLDGEIENKTAEQLPITDLSRNNLRNPMILDMLNVKYIVSDIKLDDFEQFILRDDYKDRNGKDVFLYENSKVMPRAWIVHQVEAIKKDEGLSSGLTKGFDPSVKALVSPEAMKNSALNALTDNEISKSETYQKERTSVRFYRSNRIVLEAETEKAGLLVLSEVWMPGWSAKVNGKKVPVIRTDYILRGIPLEKGKNWIELRYFPRSFVAGVFTTFTISSLVLIFLITAAVRKIMKGIRPYARKAILDKTELELKKKNII